MSGLKSHDWHKMCQFILPICVAGSLSVEVRLVIYKLAELVQWISQKEIKIASIESARKNVAELVCMIEKYFPPSMLTIQVHLLVHVIDEVEMAGTMHYRWMFFLEHFMMKTLKGFVRKRAHPEGNMVEGWLVQESLVYIEERVKTNGSRMMWLMVGLLQRSEWMGRSKKRTIVFACCITRPWRNGSMHTNALWKNDMLRVMHTEHPNVKDLD